MDDNRPPGSQGMMKVPRIKNYAPAEIQVTAE